MSKTIGGLFGRSAGGPIHEMAVKVFACAARLEPLLEAFIAAEAVRLAAAGAEVRRLENEADAIKQEIRQSLSTSLFSSVERGELILLIKTLDNVADECETVANLLLLRRTRIVPELAGLLRELRRSVTATIEALTEVTRRLSEAEDHPAGGRETQEVLEALHRVTACEIQADEREQAFLQALFGLEERLGVMDVIFLLRTAEALGRAANEAQNASDILQRLVLAR